jgi:hypothetical protein
LAARLEGCSQTPKHGTNYAKHDPRSLAQLTDRSTNSTPDEIFATHSDLASPVSTNGVTVVKLEIGYSYVDDATIGK